MAINTSNKDVIVASSGGFSNSSVTYVKTTPVKSLFPISTSQGGFAKKKIPVQLRVVQAIPKPNILIQPQIYRIVKNESVVSTSSSSIANLKFSSNPLQGTAPGTSMTTSQVPLTGVKVKLPDKVALPKITIPVIKKDPGASSLVSPNVLTKVIRVTQPSTSNSAEGGAQSVWPKPNSSTSLQANTEATQTQPERLPTIASAWSQSLQTPVKRPSSMALPESTLTPDSKRRRVGMAEKSRKGLRHFAMLVCEKVKEKMRTTYNEVADELVAEYGETQAQFPDQQYDQKNIRRRVYDALNVLMAMEIIQKDRKEIRWLGFPTNSAQELQSLHERRNNLRERVKQKTSELQELILQQIVFKNLVQRNKRLEETHGSTPVESSIHLPFIIVNTNKKTLIDCSISSDKYEYVFNFDNTFEIHDDVEVLKRMGMAYGLETGQCTENNLKTAQSLLPPALKPYLAKMTDSFLTNDNITNTFLASHSQKSGTSCSSESGVSSCGSQTEVKQEFHHESIVSMEEILGI